MTTKKIQGELEIDAERGVIYFHSNKTGTTILRICRLPKPIPEVDTESGALLDITHLIGCNWR